VSDGHAAAAAALLGALEPDVPLRIAVFDAGLRCLVASPSWLGPPDAAGRPAAEVLPPPVAPAIVGAMAEIRDGLVDARRFGHLTPRGADEPVYRVGCYGLRGPGDELLIAVLGAEITDRRRAEHRARRNRERLELAERLGGLGSWTWWPGENRWSWSEQLLELAGFTGAAEAPPSAVWLGLVDPQDRRRVLAAADRSRRGVPAEVTVRQRLPDGRDRVLRIMAVPSATEAGVARVDGVMQDVTAAWRTAAQQRVVAELGRAALGRIELEALMRRAGDAVAEALGVPDVTVDPDGVLTVDVAPPRTLSDEDRAFLHAVANVLGSAVARGRLERELTRQAEARGRLLAEALDAEDRTRREISETLHDGPLQDLLALTHQVARLEPEDERGALHFDRAQAGLRQAIAGLREVMLELHPVLLDVGGLDSALGAVAAQQGRLGGFHAEVRIEPAANGVRDELILSLARELLVNAAKHAGATHVDVAVRRSGDRLVLEVADDGAGIPDGRLDAAVRDGHIGLASSRQRVEAVGGRLVVVTALGTGTRVTAMLPA
jgi:signal transduction histidine kinase